MSFTFDDAVRVPPRVLMREIGGEAVLLQLDTSTYFGLDEVGTRMWNQLVASPSIGHACERLLAEFEVEPPVLRNDIRELTARLLAAQLLELGSPLASISGEAPQEMP